MEFQMDVLDILFRAYERTNDPRRLIEVESQLQIVKDTIHDPSDPPPSQELLTRFTKFENEFTVRKIVNGVRRPTQKSTQILVATQAYQDILQHHPQPQPPSETNLVSKMTSWLFS
jgi:hypothetical protein